MTRRDGAASYEFWINHGREPAAVPLARGEDGQDGERVDGGGFELLSGTAVAGQLELPPQGVAIVRRPG